MRNRSKIFEPEKVIGLVAQDQPFLYQYVARFKQYHITVPIGNTLHCYSAKKFVLRDISRPIHGSITSISSGNHDVTGTTTGHIQVWEKGTAELVGEWQLHQSAVASVTVVKDIIVSVDIENNLLVTNDVGDKHLEKRFPAGNRVTAVAFTGLTNKVLIGTEKGPLFLFNFNSGQTIHTFRGWQSGVSVLEMSPALDVMAFGLEDGRIIIHNIKEDRTLMSLQQNDGRVCALSFRSDNNERLLSGSVSGRIHVWDLREKALKSSVEKAHDGPIVSLVCAYQEPLAYTSSSDNAMKCFSFDLADGAGRIVATRAGHSRPPLCVRYHGSSEDVISAGEDSTIRHNVLGNSFSALLCNVVENNMVTGRWEKNKMAPILRFRTEEARDTDRDCLVNLHQGEARVSTCSLYRKKVNEKKLRHERFHQARFSKAAATCIDMSSCGSFVYVGYTTGHIDKFNIQSGEWRMSFGKRNTRLRSVIGGLLTNDMSTILVSGDEEGLLRWWCQNKGVPKYDEQLDAGIISLTTFRNSSGLFAAALDDYDIVIADIDSHHANSRIIRKFSGHTGKITDVAFTPNGKWLLSASMDCSIRVWDIPTGLCIDNFRVPSPASSLAVSPIRHTLTTTHINELGVYHWANTNFCSGKPVSPCFEDYESPLLPLPGCVHDDGCEFDESSSGDDSDCDDSGMDDRYTSPEILTDELVTIDLLPAYKWLHLRHIDHINKRNKPALEVKSADPLPFFMDDIEKKDLDSHLDENLNSRESVKEKILLTFKEDMLSSFATNLKNQRYEEAFQELQKMSPTATDFEIKSLDPETVGSSIILIEFIRMMCLSLRNKRHFESVNGYMSLFAMRLHEYFKNPDAEAKLLLTKLITELCKVKKDLHLETDQVTSCVKVLKNAAVSSIH